MAFNVDMFQTYFAISKKSIFFEEDYTWPCSCTSQKMKPYVKDTRNKPKYESGYFNSLSLSKQQVFCRVCVYYQLVQ